MAETDNPETASKPQHLASRSRSWLLSIFPMFIATLSLVTSIYNGYLNNRFVDLMQNNVARIEYMKTCKEIIDAYFAIKVRAQVLSANGERLRAGKAEASGAAGDQRDATLAIARFGALGTYLANLRDEDIRYRYTQLTGLVQGSIEAAPRTPEANLGKLFEAADSVFGNLNDDCVKSAKAQLR